MVKPATSVARHERGRAIVGREEQLAARRDVRDLEVLTQRDDVRPTIRTTNAPSRHDTAQLPVGGGQVGRTRIEEAVREDDSSHPLADRDRDRAVARSVDGDEAPLGIRADVERNATERSPPDERRAAAKHVHARVMEGAQVE